ncbi:MAG: hypothetical protein ABW133_06335 [Polyangiaceae bacterium]
MAAESDLLVTATRYHIARIQIARTLLPIATIVGIVARRLLGDAIVVVAFALLAVLLALWFSASKGLGRRRMQIRSGALRLARQDAESAARDEDRSSEIPFRSIRQWTWNGTIARLYGAEHSWKLRAIDGKDEALGESLRGALGAALILKRRGSGRARIIALVVAVLGLASAGFGIATETGPMAILGVLGLVGGFAAFGALSQHAVK